MFDVIVVGARCAGAPTAMLLARRGYRVLLLDRANFPSDTLSGHYIHQPGVARLAHWGLIDRLQALDCPAIRRHRFDAGPFTLEGEPTPIAGIADGYCPRRTVFDALLVDAAVEAGAEFRPACVVEELLWDRDQVVGVRTHHRDGSLHNEPARLVVGADGRYSLVARAVAAPAYDVRPTLACGFYSYWSGVPSDAIEVYPRAGRFIVALPTNDGLTQVAQLWPIDQFAAVRHDLERHVLAGLAEHAPELAARMQAGRRAARFRGTADLPFYFRRPFGPGWALVGDAGYHKDPITAQGMTDAFRDVDLLVEALIAGFEHGRPLTAALAEYERRRNEHVRPMFEFTHDLAGLKPPSPEQRTLLAALRDQPAEVSRFLGATAGTVSIPEFFARENIARIVGSQARIAA